MDRKEIKRQIKITHEQVSDLISKLDEHDSYQELFDTENFLHREYTSKRYLDNIEAHLKDLQELKRWLMNVTV